MNKWYENSLRRGKKNEEGEREGWEKKIGVAGKGFWEGNNAYFK